MVKRAAHAVAFGGPANTIVGKSNMIIGLAKIELEQGRK